MADRWEFSKCADDLVTSVMGEPRPCATLRIGAIGRRRIDPAARAQVEATVGAVLALIGKAAAEALEQPAVAAQFSSGAELAIISPLAEGADRLIAEAGLKAGCKLGAVLPFDQPSYENTFDIGDRLEAVGAFRSLLKRAAPPDGYGILVLDGDATPGARRDAAFLDCAAMVTRWSDILIAILEKDALSSQTGRSVGEAIALGVPVIVVDPREPVHFLVHANGELRIPAPAGRYDAMRDVVEPILAPVAVSASPEKGWRPHRYGLDDYAAERVVLTADECDFECSGPFKVRTVAPAVVRACSGLNRWIEKLAARLLHKAPAGTATRLQLWDLPLEASSARSIARFYLSYLRADAVATAYAELHRSVQIVIALLGFATVTTAALATQFRSAVFQLVELICLVAALTLVALAHWQSWLDRWLDSRLLAEIFRYSKFLLLTGFPSPFGDLRGEHEAQAGERTWTRDHAQGVFRAQRLTVPGRGTGIDSAGIVAIRPEAVAKLSRYIAERCVDDQIDYHCRIGPLREKLGALLRNASIVVSLITLLVVAAKCVLEWTTGTDTGHGSLWRPVWEVAAIVLPALTAAILALRAFGEHEVTGYRSRRMVGVLRKEREALGRVGSLKDLSDEMLAIVRLLLQHVDGWCELFSGKHLES